MRGRARAYRAYAQEKKPTLAPGGAKSAAGGNVANTLTFKAKRGTANRCYVLINNGGNDTFIFDEQAINNTWAEYSLTFTAAGNTVTLTAGTTGYYLYVADFMLAEGSQKQNWTPAPNEIYSPP